MVMSFRCVYPLQEDAFAASTTREKERERKPLVVVVSVEVSRARVAYPNLATSASTDFTLYKYQ